MKKLVLVACAIAGFVGSSFAGQTLVWNSVLNRWEYREDGQITGTSQYNSVTGGYEQRSGNGGQLQGSWHWNPVTRQYEWRQGY
jgi:hypothetical protein